MENGAGMIVKNDFINRYYLFAAFLGLNAIVKPINFFAA